MAQNCSDDNQTILFEVEGTPFEEDDASLEEDTDIEIGTGIIQSRRRRTKEIEVPFQPKSYVSIGTPIVYPLNKFLIKRGTPVPTDIQMQKNYEFYQVQLACSFDAARSCRFNDARFALALQTAPDIPNAPTQTIVEDAIVYDLFPQKIEDEYKINIRRGINPQLSLTSSMPLPSISLPFYEGTAEYVTYKGHIEAFGLQGTQPAWNFTRTPTHEISGTYKLFLIIRKPKRTQVKAILSLTANIKLIVGTIVLNPLVPLAMIFRRTRNSSELIDTPTVPLC